MKKKRAVLYVRARRDGVVSVRDGEYPDFVERKVSTTGAPTRLENFSEKLLDEVVSGTHRDLRWVPSEYVQHYSAAAINEASKPYERPRTEPQPVRINPQVERANLVGRLNRYRSQADAERMKLEDLEGKLNKAIQDQGYVEQCRAEYRDHGLDANRVQAIADIPRVREAMDLVQNRVDANLREAAVCERRLTTFTTVPEPPEAKSTALQILETQ